MEKVVLTVGCRIPGDLGEYVDFYSKKSLLDADFVFFYPSLPQYRFDEVFIEYTYSDKTEAVEHWRIQMTECIHAGIPVFLMLNTRETVNSSAGPTIGNYDPFNHLLFENMSFAEGDLMVIAPNEPLLVDYWRQFGKESRYRAHLPNSRRYNTLVTTRNGNRTVSAIIRYQTGGALVLLPWLDMQNGEFYSEEEDDWEITDEEIEWTASGKKWGRRFYQALVSLHTAIKGENQRTPVPRWAQSEAYVTTQEKLLSQKLTDIETGIAKLGKKKEETQAKLDDAGTLKALLYETGHPLNDAVLEAMRLMGFQAKNYRESDSEFDAVLECPEGRCIGEVVGRDNGAINNRKMAQLMNNVNEDYQREEVTELAKSVLFGNGYRLKPPAERPSDQFTSKCMKMAEMYRTSLVSTCDLFVVAKALSDKPDAYFANQCRKAIFETEGKVVVFPKPPKPIDVVTDHSSLRTMAFAHPQ